MAKQKVFKKKVCPVCGKKFETSDGRIKYCSKECQHEHYVKYMHDYFQHRYAHDEEFKKNHQEKNKSVYREWKEFKRREAEQQKNA